MPGMAYAICAYKFVQPHSSSLDMPVLSVRNESEAHAVRARNACVVSRDPAGLRVRCAQGCQRRSDVVSEFVTARLDLTLRQASGSRRRGSGPFVFNSK